MNNCGAIVAILSASFALSQASTFCYLNCDKTVYDLRQLACQNSTALRRPCVRSEAALSAYSQLSVVHVHNTYRSLVAQGLHAALPRTAANMKELVWSDGLQRAADRWARHCRRAPAALCSEEMASAMHGVNFGAAAAASWQYLDKNHLNVWFDEGANFNLSAARNYHFDPETARFSQLIWAESGEIGCSSGKYVDVNAANRTVDTFVCVYGPGGNRRGRSVFEEGPNYSQCPVGFQKRSRYAGLCSAKSESFGRARVHQLAIVVLLSAAVGRKALAESFQLL